METNINTDKLDQIVKRLCRVSEDNYIDPFSRLEWPEELDRDNFTDLIRLLRKYMKKNDVLSFAAGGFDRFIDNSIDWDAVVPLVDNINIMSYDFVGSGSKKTGHHTSLFSTNEQNRSADFAIKYLIEKGMPSYKIIIGAGFIINLPELKGDQKLIQKGIKIHSLMEF